jgi:Ca2+/Na+ antiporter
VSQLNPHLVLLLVISGAWYVASRLAADAFTNPTGRAVGHWLAVAIFAVIAAAQREYALAMGVALSSSVAALSLVLGVVTFATPPEELPSEARRRWSLLLPAAVTVLLIGLRSQMRWQHAALLGFEGIALLVAQIGPMQNRAAARTAFTSRSLLLLLAIPVMIFAGWYAVTTSRSLRSDWDLPSMGVIAALLIGPAMVIPMVGSGMITSQQGDYADSVSTSVTFVLFNLCVLIPVLCVISYFRSASGLPFAMPLWRVDAMVLVVLSVALLAFSLGRWTPGQAEGFALVALYILYLLMWVQAYRDRW